jgi:glycosyltransferase involved in cell wall biosynthesis
MEQPLVSIITPTYNHEKYIAECINSAISQTYQNWEMLIIDDGSTDKTQDIIKSFSDTWRYSIGNTGTPLWSPERDNRIKYIYQEHLGAYKLGLTYNKALNQTKGEFIAILEGDDFWPANKLEIQMPYFQIPNIILTYGDCFITNEYGKKLFYRNIINNKNIANNDPIGLALKEFINARNFIYAQTVMVRKDALMKIGGFIQPDYLHLVDYPTWCCLALEGKFKAIPKRLGYWRRNINSLTMSNPMTISNGFIRYVKEFIETHKNQIDKAAIYINVDELQKRHQTQLDFANKHQNYSKGIICLIYGYNDTARNYFKFYLTARRQSPRAKRGVLQYGILRSALNDCGQLSYHIISLIGIAISYTPILKITLPLIGIYFSKPLAALKRWLTPTG